MGDVVMQRSGAGFVGREAELARLSSLMAEVMDGAAAAVLVGGDAGVGKTRLVSELVGLASERGAVAAVGRCVDLGAGGLPYLPFAEALAALAGVPSAQPPTGVAAAVRAVAAQRPALLRLTGQEAGPALADDALQRLGLFDAVAVALREAGRAAGALVLVLEDLHWADAATRDLLRFLLSRLGDEQVLVIGTYRTDDLHRRHPLRGLLAELVRLPRVERFDLRPFDDAELRQFLVGLHGAAIDDRVLRDIGARSEGNPFYAGELLDAVDDCGPGSLPEALADVLLARVERLPEPVQHVARVAAVVGRRVPDALLRSALEQLADRPDVDVAAGGTAGRSGGDGHAAGDILAALRDAVAHQVLVPDGPDRFAFRHALLQEAVYGDLLPGERARLHGVLAELLAVDPDAATAVDLARHSLEAHDLPLALAAWLRAAREAERRLAPAEALTHYERALELWPAVPADRRPAGIDAIGLTLAAAHAAASASEIRRAIALARDAAATAAASSDRAAEAGARQRLAHYLYEADQDDQSLEEVRRVCALLEGLGPHPDRVWAAAVEAGLLVGRGDVWEDRRENLLATRELVEKTLVEARQLGMVSAEANLLITLARSDALLGGTQAAAARLAEASRRGAEAGDAEIALRVADHLGVNHLDIGDLPGARRILADGLAEAERSGLSSSLMGVETRLMLAETLTAMGEWDDALAAVITQRPRLPAVEVLFLRWPVLPVLVARDPEAGLAAARELVDSGFRYAIFWHLVYVPMADALAWLGRYDEALEAVHEALETHRSMGRPLALGGIETSAVGLAVLADAAAAGTPLPGAADEARALLDHAHRVAATGATRFGDLGPEGRAWARRAEAEATRFGGAGRGDVGAWRAAHDAFGYGHVYETARSGWRLAEALLAADGDGADGSRAAARAEATGLARSARETAVRLGARPLREAIDALAARHRLDVGGGVAAPRVLTPRESEVLRLVADGLTNREIGARLFISEKTVSVHVSNLLAKLGASGRAEAVSVAHRRGLLGP